MNIDLKKDTEFREKETFKHMFTVLYIMLGDARDIENEEVETDKQWEYRLKRSRKKFKEAENYLRFYIEALKQD